MDAAGTVITEYKYDAWGSILSISGTQASTIGQINPYRYRSYYYDTESGLYYLNSRYYDPQVKRFLNADDSATLNATPTELTDKNLFAYCDNNPVMNVDPTGYLSYKILYGWFGIPYGFYLNLTAEETNLVSQLLNDGAGVSTAVAVIAGAIPELASKEVALYAAAISAGLWIYSGIVATANYKGTGISIRINFIPIFPYYVCTGIFPLNTTNKNHSGGGRHR